MSGAARPDAERIGRAPDALIFLVIVAGIWVAWQILRNALVLTAPHDLALRLGPNAPILLARAAETELRAGNVDAARRYAQRSLALKPFNVAALRVAGLAADREGDADAADRMLTLAGNWSLRDDPAHSWLVKRRLEQGQAASALAHADTLLRRRADVRPRYFDLMIALASRNDRQAQGALVALLQRSPPWRLDFFIHALERREGLPVAAALVAALKAGPHPVTVDERSRVYQTLIVQGRTDVLRALMKAVGDTEVSGVSDGGFDKGGGTPPFDWKLPSSAGVLAEIAPDADGQPALHALISQTGRRSVAEQLVLLAPGRWRITGRVRIEQGPAEELAWTLSCAAGGRELGAFNVSAGDKGGWARFTGVVDAPEACPAQYLRLITLPRERGEPMDVWIDDVAAARAS